MLEEPGWLARHIVTQCPSLQPLPWPAEDKRGLSSGLGSPAKPCKPRPHGEHLFLTGTKAPQGLMVATVPAVS